MPDPTEYSEAVGPQLQAGIDLIGRSGARDFELRYSDTQWPTVWMAIAIYGKRKWDVAAAPDPLTAVFRLCEQLIDGGKCQYCEKPIGFTPDFDQMPANELVCWYQYDPELKKFRRGCEGQ